MKTFFVPAHLTGFFEIRSQDDPLKTGSRGAGIVLDKGVRTGVAVAEAEETDVKVFYDGLECSCPTTVSVVKDILGFICGTYDVEVHHFSELPVEYGFGLSASGAIGTALALNDFLELNFDKQEIGGIAHRAEVSQNTGLGDVIAEFSKGMVIREKEGPPGRGKIRSYKCEKDLVAFIVGEGMATKSVLKDNSKRALINKAGRELLKIIMRKPSTETFLELSKRFTFETGLASRSTIKAIKSLDESGVTSAMSMLGNAVFTLTEEPEKIRELLNYPSITASSLKSEII